MRRRRVLATSVVGATVVIAASVVHTQAPGAQTVFRTTTDVVTVDVSVRNGGTPAAGLKPEDFLVLDNGVRQHVDSLETEAVPVNVTVIVDTNEETYDSNENVNRQVQSIATRLRPGDELRVLRLDTYVTEVLPMRPAPIDPPLDRLPPGHLASVYDALAAALLFQVPLNRRHLIIAITNGIDTMSTLDAATVRDIARHSNATLHLAQVDMSEYVEFGDITHAPVSYWDSRRERERANICAASGRCEPKQHFWQPHYEPTITRAPQTDRFALLHEAARLTGGDLHQPGLFQRNASDIFESVFKDFRQNYLLHYTPQGVRRPGWHELKVSTPTYPGYTIHARSGYAVEEHPTIR
jgi:VWFA-related protein